MMCLLAGLLVFALTFGLWFCWCGVGCLGCFGCLGLFGWGCLYLLGCLIVGRMR